MALEVFEKACTLTNFTVFDLVAFSEIDRSTSSDFDYCTKLVNIVEAALICKQCHLDAHSIKAFSDFMANVLTAVESNTTDDGYLDIGDGVKRILPIMLKSREAMLYEFKVRGGLGLFTKFLPGDFVSHCSEVVCDPFAPVKDTKTTEVLIKHLAIVDWALNGYGAVLRMCLTADQMQWGRAADDVDGQNVDAFFEQYGVRLNHGVGQDGKQSIFGTPCFGADYIQCFGVTSTQERYVLPSPASVREDSRNTVREVGMEAANNWRMKWQAYVAYYGQQVMRARHFDLVGTSRKELVYIRRIKEVQDKAMNKSIAVAVTLGITLGQFGAQFASSALFKTDSETCLNVCNAG